MSGRRRGNEDERGPWYLLTGLVLGLALGLGYAWGLAPVRYVDTAPAYLREDFKAQYRALSGVAYLSDYNFERAQARLLQLRDADPALALAQQLERWPTEGRPASEVQGLNELLAALMQGAPPQPSPAASAAPAETSTPALTPDTLGPSTATVTPVIVAPGTPGSATSTPTAGQKGTATITPLPTRTSTPTPGGAFELKSQELVCDATVAGPLIAVSVEDAGGAPIPNVEIAVRWDGGRDSFITGLKPELGLGYADYSMQEDVSYTIQLPLGSAPVSGLEARECEGEGGTRFWGAWKLVFAQK